MLEGFQISFQVIWNIFKKSSLWRMFLLEREYSSRDIRNIFVWENMWIRLIWWRWSFLLDLERLVEKPLPRINWPVARSKREAFCEGWAPHMKLLKTLPTPNPPFRIIDMIWAETLYWRFYNIMRVSSFFCNIHVCACFPNWKTVGEMIEKQAWNCPLW